MSNFADNVIDIFWATGENFIDRLKALSSSMVEGDEYVLIFVLFLGVPAVIVMALIARYIRRTHDRVRYATEYEEQNPDAFVTSSSSATDSSITESDDDNDNTNNGAAAARTTRPGGGRGANHRNGKQNKDSRGGTGRVKRAAKQYTMDEVYSVAQRLTEEETQHRREVRRAEAAAAKAAAAEAEAEAEAEAAAQAATEEKESAEAETVAETTTPLPPTEESSVAVEEVAEPTASAEAPERKKD